MGDIPDGPPVVPLPERFDRRLRLGPFASAREALRFVTYVAVGAVVAPFTSPYLWVVVLVGGFAACVIRTDGQALDERAFSFARWKLRRDGSGRKMSRSAMGLVRGAGFIGIRPGQYVAILRTGGTPMTYLPPVELARRFELFRDLVRSVGGGFAFQITSVPMRPGPVVPAPIDAGRVDCAPRDGYSQLVELLCRRRQIRRIDLALSTERTGPEGISDLEVRISTLRERLAGLGLRAVRLRGRALADAARRWGWS